MYQPFPIVDFQSGVRTDKEPWLLLQDALARLENGHVYRGRVVKRPPAKLLTKLGTKVIGEALGTLGAPGQTIGNTTGGSLPGSPAVSNMAKLVNLPLVPPTVTPLDKPITFTVAPYVFKVGALVSGNVYTLVWDSGAALAQPYTAQINLATGAWFIQLTAPDAFTATAKTVTYEFYRGLPPMLITEWENAAGARELVVCDTKRLFVWNAARLRFDDKLATGATLATDDVWSGSNVDFFSSAVVDDGSARKLVIVNGVNLPKKWTGTTLSNMGVSGQLTGARFVFAVDGYVIYLAPIVGGAMNRQRAMWSDQFIPETVQAANYALAFTGERLVTAAKIGREISVVFEKSTWKLYPTDDFRVGAQWSWDHIAGGDGDRQETIGALSPMGTVGLSEHLVTIGTHGLTKANGAGAKEGAPQTPNLMLDLIDPTRMGISYGVAFDQEEKLWFSAVTSAQDGASIEPNKTMVVDINSGAISFYDWSFRIFGLFRRQESVPNWDDVPWANELLGNVSVIPGASSGRAGFPTVLAGTLDGSIYEIPSGDSGDGLGDSTMLIEFKELNPFTVQTAQADLGFIELICAPSPGNTLTIFLYEDDNDFAYAQHTISLDAPSGKKRLVKRIRVNRTANSHRVKIEQTGGDRWAFDGIIPWMQPAAEMARYA